MPALPSGTVTFVFTDVEGSTRLWEQAPDTMMGALARHDEVIEQATAAHRGEVVKPRGEGDSRFLVFSGAVDAIEAAADIQRGLSTVEWPTPSPIVVRIALHTGTASLESGDYYGTAVNRAARLRGIGHGGQTLISRATWDLVRDELPDGVSVRDMGRHRLKDLSRPEHVFQLDIDGHPNAFPPLNSLDAVPNNLPQQLTDFVGRADELAEAKRLLAGGRFLTILGPGGAGKSRLALQTAADLSGDYRNGVFFVPLAPIESADDIVSTIAEAVGVPLSSEDDLQSQLLAYLRTKQQLLVLDNFEHVGHGAGVVGAILQNAPDVSVLVTSRSRLSITGETTLVLSGLEYRWETPELALQCEAAELFLDAAQRRRPDFTVGDADLDALGTILSALQGMPLGILLAAAWIDLMPLEEIATEVVKSLDFLESDLGDVPDRHQSIRAVFEYSWRLLGEDEQSLFAALSVFRGGFDRAAAEAVAEASLRDLAGLVNKSLLTADPHARRYSIHELLRQYAEQKLAEDGSQDDEARRRHADFYGAMMQDANDVFRSGDQSGALARVEDDIENVRTAWRFVIAGHDSAGARRFIESLWLLYEVRGWYLPGRMLFSEAADRLAEPSGTGEARVEWALCTAMVSWFSALLGAPDKGLELATQAVATLREVGESKDLALVLMIRNLSLIFTDVARLRANVDEALGEARRAEDGWMTDLLESWDASCAVMEGDAKRAAEIGAALQRRIGDVGHQWLRNWSYQSLAGAARMEGRPEDAVGYLESALSVDAEIDFRRGIQYALNNLGVVTVDMGRFEEAEAYFLRSLAVSEEIGQTREMLHTLCDIAQARAGRGKEAEAVTLIAAALTNPASSQLSVYRAPIDEMAEELRARLERDLEPAVYAEAWERGRTAGIEPLVRDLLTGTEIGSR